MPYADNNGVEICCEVEGEGPPLVLAHAPHQNQTPAGRSGERPAGATISRDYLQASMLYAWPFPPA